MGGPEDVSQEGESIMGRTLRILIIALCLAVLGTYWTKPLPGHAETVRVADHSYLREYGDLAATVVAYKGTLPRRDSQAYVQPTEHELAQVAAAIESVDKNDLDAAASALAPLSS